MHRGKRYALVAGGAGFIGFHLVESLLRDGWAVDIVDNFSTGKKENVQDLIDSPLNAAITDGEPETLLECVAANVYALRDDPARDNGRVMSQYDVVYNLACRASPVAYQADGLDTIMTNVMGTTNLLGLAKHHNAKFVQASTSEVYGDPAEHPQKETYWGNVNPFGPRSCYDEGKRCAETLCWEFRKLGVDVRVARIFNTYGPRMDPNDGRVVSNFVRQAINGEPLTIYGEGTQTRSFCYVSDLVSALRMLAEAPIAPQSPVNIGNDGEFKISELAEALTEWFPRVDTVHESLPVDDPTVRKPDLTLARSLGYQPTVSLREGLALTVEWMKEKLK